MDIRTLWKNYYKKAGYKEVPHDPLVHEAFPTSFNMSAGLVQLDSRIRSKNIMPKHEEVIVQQCVRNFDIAKVGDDSHLSFFEMAGASQVAEYDKKQTILLVWNFLIDELELNPDKLWGTVFVSDKVEGRTIELDKSILQLVQKITSNKTIIGNKESNLWQQGGGAELTDNKRLCGPQVEFFYDLGKTVGCKDPTCSPLCKCGRFLEISNTLFIEYYIDYSKEPTLYDLPNKATESVIGLERCLKVAEGKESLYSTSAFAPIFDTLPIGTSLNEDTKIIMDHMKSLLFILSENRIAPSTRDRGRIVRTLIRNLLSATYSEKLNTADLFPKLCSAIAKMYTETYPYLEEGSHVCLDVIFAHEKEYKSTLERGAIKIKEYINNKGLKTLNENDFTYFWEKFGFPKKLLPVYGIS